MVFQITTLQRMDLAAIGVELIQYSTKRTL